MIVVALPPEEETTWLARLPEGMRHCPCRCEALQRRMQGWTPHTIGTAQCSCDLFQPQTEERAQSLRRKYEKRGWSHAKIDRALASFTPRGFAGGLHPDLRRWLADATTAVGNAYLFVHWDSVKIVVGQEVPVTASEFQSAALAIAEERLYHLKAL